MHIIAGPVLLRLAAAGRIVRLRLARLRELQLDFANAARESVLVRQSDARRVPPVKCTRRNAPSRAAHSSRQRAAYNASQLGLREE